MSAIDAGLQTVISAWDLQHDINMYCTFIHLADINGTGAPSDQLGGRAACPGGLSGGPILVGSGVTEANGASYLEFADGFIVGTSVKRDGEVSNPVDSRRVAALKRVLG